jgi:exonuclease SbcC
MIPIHLTISGFLSYRDPVDIDFTRFDLACIAGHNGAGKSSILDAITWSLFGQARKRDDSIINLQSEIAEIVFVFKYEGNIYRVIRTNPRGKPTKLEFQIASRNLQDATPILTNQENIDQWKTLSERTQRATQDRIQETLNLDYETFVNAAFFLQGKADQFTQQRPGDRKRILASILGLEVWETYRLRASDQRKNIESEILSLDGRLAEINAELSEEATRKGRLAELRTDLESLSQARVAQELILQNIKQITATLVEQRKLVGILSQQLQNTQKQEQDLTQRLNTRQQEKENYTQILERESKIKTAYQAWIESREALAHWDAIADQFRDQEKHREAPRLEIESEKAGLTQELNHLKEQLSSITSLQASIPEIQISLASLTARIEETQSDIEVRRAIESELISAQETLANARAENPRLKAEMDDLKSRIDQLNETDGAACPLCGAPLSAEERKSLVENLTELGKTMGDKYRANRALLGDADTKVKGLKTRIQNLTHLEDKLLSEKNQHNKMTAQLENIEIQKLDWDTKGAPRLEEITTTLRDESFALEARAALAEIDVELKVIGYDAAGHDAIRRAEREGRSAEEESRRLERAIATLEPLQNEITSLESQLNELKSNIRIQAAEHDQAAAALAAAEAQAPDIQGAQRDLLDIQEKENRLRLEVGAAQQKVLVLDDLKTRRKLLESDREILAQKVGQYKQLERAFGKDGVPALLIESALPQIETKANEILERLSGGSMSVQFITQRKYKDKKREDRRETLEIQISDSAGVRDYEMFSGGEAFRVNFAIRLALSEILAQRAGARLQTLVIDEGFGSQDSIGRQRLIEAINTVKADFAKILVITHIESLKDAFPTRIEVEKTRRGSTINIV